MRTPSRHVAIVDDDLPVRKALARVLAARSFHAATYGSARDFIASLDETIPECVIIDVHMPDMTGPELHRHLLKTGYRIPTVFITAHDEPETRQMCLSSGASGYLTKPLDERLLVEAVSAATRVRQSSHTS